LGKNWEKSANSRKNVNNKKMVKKLGQKIEKIVKMLLLMNFL
jgi:hypothetical protein